MTSITLRLTENHMKELTKKLALYLKPGMIFLLKGDLGAGKTTFSRNLIQSFHNQEDLFVPSPTFNLVQIYDYNDQFLWHCDLYRCESSEEIFELGLLEAFNSAICLIEWPERLGNFIPEKSMEVEFKIIDNSERLVTFSFKEMEIFNGIGEFLSKFI